MKLFYDFVSYLFILTLHCLSYSELIIVRSFPKRFFSGTMTSADFLQFVVTTGKKFFSACKTSSGKRNHLHLIYLLHLHLEIRAVLDFFQTPSHGGRPCLRLTVPTAEPVADFHRQVITRAEHTKTTAARIFVPYRRLLYADCSVLSRSFSAAISTFF